MLQQPRTTLFSPVVVHILNAATTKLLTRACRQGPGLDTLWHLKSIKLVKFIGMWSSVVRDICVFPHCVFYLKLCLILRLNISWTYTKFAYQIGLNILSTFDFIQIRFTFIRLNPSILATNPGKWIWSTQRNTTRSNLYITRLYFILDHLRRYRLLDI